MCNTKEFIKILSKYNRSYEVISELLNHGWLIRPVDTGACYGGYAFCGKCFDVVSWWVCPPPEYDGDITVSVGLINSILKQRFEEDAVKTVFMLKKVNNKIKRVPVNIPL
jgi:hypothetical protein